MLALPSRLSAIQIDCLLLCAQLQFMRYQQSIFRKNPTRPLTHGAALLT
jgi:hypothetical protein